MTTPNTASIALSGIAPRIVINTRLVPGDARLHIVGQQLFPEVEYNSLVTDLPYILSTFSESRRIIRQTYDEIRDVIFQARDNEVYLVLELDGSLFNASRLLEVQLECTNIDTDATVSINSTTNPEIFDLTRTVVMRGQYVKALVISLNATNVANLFTTGIWSVEIFATDADHSVGVHWGTLEWEVRSLFEGVFISPSTGGLTLTTTVPTVVYRNLKPATADLSLIGNAPILSFSGAIRPSTGSIAMSGVAPIRTP